MDVTSMDIYWLTRCDNIISFFIALAAISFVVTILAFICHVEPYRESKVPLRVFVFSALICLVSTICGVLTPSTKELAAIVVIPKIANSETVQGIGREVVYLARAWLNELKPESGKKEGGEK